MRKVSLPQMTRRKLLASGAAASAALLSASEFPKALADLDLRPGLGAIAARKGMIFGASFSVGELDAPSSSKYAQLYQRDARILTSELEFKMHTLRPAADTIDIGPADRLVGFARENGMLVRGHTLIWNDYLPDWVRKLPAKDAERLLEEHVTAIAGRYRGKVYEWDVVNEPIGPWDKLEGNLRGGAFYSALGEGYIDKSFHLAKAADPDARLFLNEAQTESDDENGRTFRESFLALLRRLVDRGVPLTGAGLQCHLSSKFRYDFARFADFVRDIAALGLEISITELDCNDTAFPDDISARDTAVADMYRRFLDAVLPISQVKLLTTWQLADEKSWLWYSDVEKNPHAKRRPRPLLYDAAFAEKPAYQAMAGAFAAMKPR